MNAPSIAAIILAAGASRRLGQPKQLVRLGPETLLDRTVRIAREAGCDPILVVLGAEAALVQSRSKLTGATVVVNEHWSEGMATSIHAATDTLFSVASPQQLSFRPERTGAEKPAPAPVQAQSEIEAARTSPLAGAILMVCDQPAVNPQHLRALAVSGQTTASSYAGRQGVPAFFPSSAFAQLSQLTGDVGARELLRAAASIPLRHGELDVDTPAELVTARQLFGS